LRNKYFTVECLANEEEKTCSIRERRSKELTIWLIPCLLFKLICQQTKKQLRIDLFIYYFCLNLSSKVIKKIKENQALSISSASPTQLKIDI